MESFTVNDVPLLAEGGTPTLEQEISQVVRLEWEQVAGDIESGRQYIMTVAGCG